MYIIVRVDMFKESSLRQERKISNLYIGIIRPPHQVWGIVPELGIELKNLRYTGIIS